MNIPLGERATLYSGSANLRTILQEEMSGKYIKRVQKDEQPGEMLVMGKISTATLLTSY